MSVKVKVIDKRQQAVRQIAENYEKHLASVVFQSATFCRNEAVTNIAQGVKTGKTYKRGNIIHTASAAGEYPATDTGELIEGITIKMDAGNMGASVESNAPYSAALEFGTRFMAARPFLQPSLEATRAQVKKFLRQILGKKK